MDELRPQTPLLRTQQPAPSVNKAATTAEVDTRPATSNANSTTTALPNKPINNATALQQLLGTLQKTPQVNVQVGSVQTLPSKAAQQFIQSQATLPKQAQALNTSTKPAPVANPTLYLVKLFQANSQQHVLTTVTPHRFSVGDRIELLLNQQQQLVVKPSSAGIRNEIISALKQSLPAQHSISHLLNTINKLQQLPAPLQQRFLSNPVITPLHTLSTFAKLPTQLSTPAQVKTTLINTGISTEQKIQQQQPLTGDLRATLAQLQKILSAETGSTHHSSALKPLPTSTAALDTVLGLLTQNLHTTSTGANKPTAEIPKQQLSSLLQLLGIKTSATDSTYSKKIKDYMQQQLKGLIHQAQDKIQLNQLRSLNIDLSNPETTSSRQAHYTTEIPLRWGEQVLPLQVSIKDLYEEDKAQQHEAEDSPEENNITRRWKVFLSFDLPAKQEQNTHIVQLHAQLIIIEDSVSATLWTTSQHLCAEAKKQLKQLRNNLTAKGLNVDELHCIQGEPPEEKMQLNTHLVDIKT